MISDIDSSRQSAELNADAVTRAEAKTRKMVFDGIGINKRQLAQSDEAPTDERGVNNGDGAIQENRAAPQSGTKPAYLKPDFDGMPGELKLLRQWVCWRFLWDGDAVGGDGKWTKVPYIARIYWREPARPMKASTTDPSTWRNYDDLRAAYEASQSWSDPFDGVGFVFDGKVDEDGLCLCGLDFDAWTAAEQELCGRIGTTYVEVSPGGSGVHAIARARPFDAATCKTDALKAEAYCKGRYFTITGQRLEGGVLQPVEGLPDEILEAVAEIRQVAGSAPRRRERDRALSQGDVLIRQSTLFDALPDEWDDLTYMPPEPLDLVNLASAVWALPDELVADEGSWMNLLCRALANEAERANDDAITEQLYTLLDARSRNVTGYSETGNRARFERCMKEYDPDDPVRRPILSGSVYQRAEEYGWAWSPPTPQGLGASSAGGAGPQFGIAGAPGAIQLGDISINTPARRWAWGTLLLYGEVTIAAAPGATGKTAFAISLALSAASGRDLLEHKVFLGAQRVLHISAEDDERELRRRYVTAARHHQIVQKHLDNVWVRGIDTGDKQRLSLMVMEGRNAKINDKGFTQLIKLILETEARIVILEPLGHFVGGGLLDNSAMAALMAKLKDIATAYDVSIFVLHHTNKGGGDSESVEAIMGASAITNFSRVAVRLLPITLKEADTLKLLPSQAEGMFRISKGKRNYSKDITKELWFWQHPVSHGNAEQHYPHGDNIGVVEVWKSRPSVVKAPGTVSNVEERIVLGVIDHPPNGIPLTLGSRSPERYYHKPVLAALKNAGVTIVRGDEKAKVRGIMNKLEIGKLIIEKDVPYGKGNSKKELSLTDAGRNVLNNV